MEEIDTFLTKVFSLSLYIFWNNVQVVQPRLNAEEEATVSFLKKNQSYGMVEMEDDGRIQAANVKKEPKEEDSKNKSSSSASKKKKKKDKDKERKKNLRQTTRGSDNDDDDDDTTVIRRRSPPEKKAKIETKTEVKIPKERKPAFLKKVFFKFNIKMVNYDKTLG